MINNLLTKAKTKLKSASTRELVAVAAVFLGIPTLMASMWNLLLVPAWIALFVVWVSVPESVTTGGSESDDK